MRGQAKAEGLRVSQQELLDERLTRILARKQKATGSCSEHEREHERERKRRPVQKLDEVCNNYLAGKCRYGDECRRVHEGDIEQKVEKLDETGKGADSQQVQSMAAESQSIS